jgi:hypothetical protein
MLYLWKIVLLFVVLTPGILLTIPPIGKKIFGSGKSNFTAACVHAVIFVVLLNLFNVEGFQDVPSMPKRSVGASANTNMIYNDVVKARNSIIKAKAVFEEQQNSTTKYSEDANMARIRAHEKSEEIRVVTIEAEEAKISYEEANKRFEEANNGIAEKLALLNRAETEFKQKLDLFNESVKKDQEAAAEKARAAALVKVRAPPPPPSKTPAKATFKPPPPPPKVLPKLTPEEQAAMDAEDAAAAAGLVKFSGPKDGVSPTMTTYGSGSGIMGNLLSAVGLAPTQQGGALVRDANGAPIVINDGYTCDGVVGNIVYADPAMVKLWIPSTKEQQLFAPQTCKHR